MNNIRPYNFTLIGTLAKSVVKSTANKAINKAKNLGGRVLDRAVYGYNDYNPVTGANKKSDLHKNLALRTVEGGIGGGLLGATAGTITGHIRRKQAMEAARREAMQGTGNKILNALDRHRLRDIGNEAARQVSVAKHAIAGAGIGMGVGAGGGALETLIKHKLADREYQGMKNKFHNSAVKYMGSDSPELNDFISQIVDKSANTYFEGKKGMSHKQRKSYKEHTHKVIDNLAKSIAKGHEKSHEEPKKEDIKPVKTETKSVKETTSPSKVVTKSSPNKSKSPESILGKILSFFSETNNRNTMNYIQFSRCIHND